MKVKDFKFIKSSTIINIITVTGLFLSIFLMFWGYKAGLFTSQERLNAFLLNLGTFGPLIFILLQVVQVVIPVIPGGVSSIAGVLIFGPFRGTIYNYVGIVTGSFINYFLARYYGREFVTNIIGSKKMDSYTKYLSKGKKFDNFFALAIFLPIAPDDILCLFAGLLNMNIIKFTLIILFLKPWSLLIYTLGGKYFLTRFLFN